MALTQPRLQTFLQLHMTRYAWLSVIECQQKLVVRRMRLGQQVWQALTTAADVKEAYEFDINGRNQDLMVFIHAIQAKLQGMAPPEFLRTLHELGCKSRADVYEVMHVIAYPGADNVARLLTHGEQWKGPPKSQGKGPPKSQEWFWASRALNPAESMLLPGVTIAAPDLLGLRLLCCLAED